MPVEIIGVAEWRPDLPDLSDATSIATNVVPLTPMSYGPLPALTAVSSSALDGQCIGAATIQDNEDNVWLFAGTVDKLYTINSNAYGWQDVSGQVYATPAKEKWRFALFQGVVYATNFGVMPQSYTPGTSTTFNNMWSGGAWLPNFNFTDVGSYIIANGNRYVLTTAGTSASSGTGPSGTGAGIIDGSCVWNYFDSSPPSGKYICTPKNFLMLGVTSDPVGGVGPRRIWWSANGDATSFPSPGSNAAIEGMSDYNDFQGNFGEITGLVDSLANADVAIFFEHAVWRGVFAGPPDVFDFFPTENVRGCPAPSSIVPLGAMVYYLGEDGFYMFDGAQSSPIGANKFDQWFWKNVNSSYLYNVVGAADVANRRIIWAFPSAQSADGVSDSLLIYRWDIQRASYGYLGPDAVEWLMRSLAPGYSMDTMSAFGYDDVDTLPASLDSPFWGGGIPILGAVNGSHQLAYFSGAPLGAQVAMQTKQLTPGRRSFVQSSRPLVDLTEGTPSVAFSARVNLYDPEVFGAATSPNAAGECPQRSDGRYHNAMVTLPAGANWQHIVGVETTFVQGGTR